MHGVCRDTSYSSLRLGNVCISSISRSSYSVGTKREHGRGMEVMD